MILNLTRHLMKTVKIRALNAVLLIAYQRKEILQFESLNLFHSLEKIVSEKFRDS